MKNKTIKILAIGNSFSVDSMEYLGNVANDLGFNFILGNLYIGGCSIKTHWHNAQNNLSAYTYYKNTNGNWETLEDKSILEAFNDEQWDFISIQQASGTSGVISTYNDDLLNLIKYIKQYNQSAKIMWNMTWAYSKDSDHGEFINYNGDQMTMYKKIVDTVRKIIITNKDIEFVIPTGTAIQNMRTSFVGDTLNRDGFHLSYDLGRFVASLTWFKAITNYPIDHLNYLPVGVSKELLPVIKEAVDHAISNPFDIIESSFK